MDLLNVELRKVVLNLIILEIRKLESLVTNDKLCNGYIREIWELDDSFDYINRMFM